MRRGPATSLPALLLTLVLPLAACSGDGDGDGPDAAPSSSTSSSGGTGDDTGDYTGDDTPAPPTPTTTSIEELVASLPQCADVWVADQVLPVDYAGCKLPGGGIDLGVVLQCADGAGLAAYRDRFWARLGEPVEDSGGGGTQQDPEYATAVGLCRGE